ncbi:MAG: M20/M25/M40 family metallo-hydrolase [Thermomicrobiales bacterium]
MPDPSIPTSHPTAAGRRAVEILHDLIAIPSVNPAYDLTSDGEVQVALYVAAWARALGLPVERQTVFPATDDHPARDNIRVRLTGPDGAPTLLLEAHMDTVSPDAMPDAFMPAERGGRLYGRGSCDTKGSLAAMMAAVEALATDGAPLSCTVELLAAVDEETQGTGVFAYVRAGNRPAAAIVGEPTELRVIHAHNGCLRGEIAVTGRAAHTSIAHEGVNAIEGMAPVIMALAELNREIASRPGGAADHGSLTVSLVSGGTGLNIVPERCTIAYDRRTVPGDRTTPLLAEIDAALDAVRRTAMTPGLSVERQTPSLDIAALLTPLAEPIVRTAVEANASLGLDSIPTKVPYGSDASTLQEGGIPAIVYGPGNIVQAHGADEYVELIQVEQAAAFYVAVARTFMNAAISHGETP